MSFLFGAILIASCVPNQNQEEEKQVAEGDSSRQRFIYLSTEQLQQLGIFIKDTSIMYNNNMGKVGSLNIVVRGKSYSGNSAKTEQTNLKFYPRYITTKDTVQRAMYMISGNHARSEEEALKWQSFDNLVPIIVEQKQGDYVFGETLVFWMTKTSELEQMIKKLQSE
ncbi:MAG: hypothetical protein ACLFNU_05705 [Bacteroidales bacterium]